MAAVVVHHHLLRHHCRALLLAALVAQGELYLVDAVGQGEALHVEETEVQLVEAAHRGAAEVVLLGEDHGVLLPRHEGHLHRGLVHPRGLLHEAHRPGVDLQVGLHVRAVFLRQIEGAVAEQSLHLRRDGGRRGESRQCGQYQAKTFHFTLYIYPYNAAVRRLLCGALHFLHPTSHFTLPTSHFSLHTSQLMGQRRSRPKLTGATLSCGANWRRFHSLRATPRSTLCTTSRS